MRKQFFYSCRRTFKNMISFLFMLIRIVLLAVIAYSVFVFLFASATENKTSDSQKNVKVRSNTVSELNVQAVLSNNHTADVTWTNTGRSQCIVEVNQDPDFPYPDYYYFKTTEPGATLYKLPDGVVYVRVKLLDTTDTVLSEGSVSFVVE